MYHDGKKIRRNVPQLPEANEPQGQFPFTGSDRTIRLLTLGESTIAGVGVKTHQDGFTGALACELSQLFEAGVKWSVYAKSGFTAKKVTRKLVPQISESTSDIIVIGLGGNDAFELNSPMNWRKDIEQLITDIRAVFLEAVIVFINMPPIKEFPAFTPVIKFTIGNLVEILGEELKSVISEYENIYYAEEKITLAEWAVKAGEGYSNADFFSDGVHPSQLTYQTWGREIARKIYQEQWITLE
jgi:lysophospholipase L1-like esterase